MHCRHQLFVPSVVNFVWQRALELLRHSLLQALRHDRIVPIIEGVCLAASPGAGVVYLDGSVSV